MSEYQSREYCRDIECPLLADAEKYGGSVACEGCGAYHFHDWLQEKGYKIMKGDDEK